MKKIAFLGPQGTVSEEATRHFFGSNQYEHVPFPLIVDVFGATVAGQTNGSVIPIENTIDGSVSLHVDLLVHQVDLPIRAEWIYPSIQNLCSHAPDSNLSQIRKVISHPVAIAQCQRFLKEYLPDVEIEHASSTAEGVRQASTDPTGATAGIGTRLAAEKYGVPILASDVQDHRNNYTRFILISEDDNFELPETSLYKTSILVTLPEDYPGALHQVLSAFAWRRINLSRIESRPTKKQLGNYFFYIDIEARLDTVLLRSAIEEIQEIGSQVRILGSYPSYTYPIE